LKYLDHFLAEFPGAKKVHAIAVSQRVTLSSVCWWNSFPNARLILLTPRSETEVATNDFPVEFLHVQTEIAYWKERELEQLINRTWPSGRKGKAPSIKVVKLSRWGGLEKAVTCGIWPGRSALLTVSCGRGDGKQWRELKRKSSGRR